MKTTSTTTVLYRHLSDSFSVEAVRYPPRLAMAPHEHAFAGISIVLAGTVRETSRAGDEIGGAGAVVVKPRGVRHSDAFGDEGAIVLSVKLHDATFLGPLRKPASVWLRSSRATSAALVVGVALMQRGGDRAVTNAVIDLCGSAGGEAHELTASPPPKWLAEVRERMHDERERPLSVAAIAGDLGYHAVYVARCFRRWFGCSITEYARHLRAASAIGAAIRTRTPFSSIAHETAFTDHSHMTRQVRRVTRNTPRSLRGLGAFLEHELAHSAFEV